MNLKDIKLVRILLKPYVDWKKKKMHEQYLLTPDHFYLQTLRGIHEGKRCFIIGNGPSLRAEDLDLLRGEYTFAANRIFNIFDKTDWRPTYYLSVDDRLLKEIQNDLLNYELGHMFLRYGKCDIATQTLKVTKIYIDSLALSIKKERFFDTEKYISEDISDHFCDGTTVTFEAIQLAIFMGFQELYLLGMDHNYSRTVDATGKIHIDTTVEDYFDHNRYIDGYPSVPNNTQYAYIVAKEYCDNHNIKIFNATRGGKLEIFQRVDFDIVMKKIQQEGTR